MFSFWNFARGFYGALKTLLFWRRYCSPMKASLREMEFSITITAMSGHHKILTLMNHSMYNYKQFMFGQVLSTTQLLGLFDFHHVWMETVIENFSMRTQHTSQKIFPWLSGEMFDQHDGAPPYFRLEVRQWLHTHFPEKWIGRGNDAPEKWPARSLDLTPLDFYMWGTLKDVFQSFRYGKRAQGFNSSGCW